MPFVAPKSTTTATPSTRTSFRPPWVKDDGAPAGLKATPKTSVPWAKKTADSTAAAAATTATKDAGATKTPTTSILKKPSTNSTSSANSKSTNAEPKKTLDTTTKKNTEPAKKLTGPVKKEPVTSTAAKGGGKTLGATKKKEPTPPSSSEEEDDEEEEEEETEEESEEEETEEEESEEEESEEEESEEEESEEEEPQQKNNKKPLATPQKPAASNATNNKKPLVKQSNTTNSTQPATKPVPAPPPLPSLVPKAPPPPPPPLGPNGEKRELSDKQKEALDKLKTRPRRRPDWSEMMKEVESNRKLRHVECNDRSQPILTCKSMTKVDNKFIYETEKHNSHNKLLQQIQGGIKLKPTQTNDRSKPFIDGLRKFRRQMTIEEQLQKSQSKVNMLGSAATSGNAAAGGDTTDGIAHSASSTRAGSIVSALIDDPSGDELDDIDKIRDDLQSTKQMLALELRNREAQERENKKLLAKIATLEAELEREKSREKTLEYGSRIIVATMETTPATEEAYVNSLKNESEESRKTAKDLESKYLKTGELLDQAKTEIEEQKRQIQSLERKLAQAMQGGYDSRRPSDALNGRDSSPDFEPESESDPDEPEEKKVARRERRAGKEVKVLRSKLTKLKVKEEAAKKEKAALKEAMKKNHVILKEENKKFKRLEKEVHKMAASMKEDAEDEEDGEEKEDAEEEAEESEDESEEESEESESEESGNETQSESEAEDAANSAKRTNLDPRVKKHESRFNAMKKCNVLLQANVDNLQDEIHQIRSKASNLQSELDSVLADLGF